MSHTPGPWVVGVSADNGIHCVDTGYAIGLFPMEICEVWGEDDDLTMTDQSLGNARLIAADPYLSFASYLYATPLDQMLAAYKAEGDAGGPVHDQRQVAKAAVLALGFGQDRQPLGFIQRTGGTEMSHTPGPCPFCESGDVKIRSKGRMFQAYCDDCCACGPLLMNTKDEVAAHWNKVGNAIAAATDVLEALKETRTSLMIVAYQTLDAAKTDSRWEGVCERLLERVRDADAAIAKAEGQE